MTNHIDRSGSTTKQRRAEITRESIVEAAATVFNAAGYAAASLNEIIEIASSTKGALYFHFSSKSDLASHLIDGWTSALRALEERAAETSPSPLGQLIMISHAHAALVAGSDRHRAGLRLSIEPHLAGDGHFQSWQGRLGALVDDAIAAGELRNTAATRGVASIYCATLIGLLNTLQLHSDLEDRIGDLLAGWLLGITAQTSYQANDRVLALRLPLTIPGVHDD